MLCGYRGMDLRLSCSAERADSHDTCSGRLREFILANLLEILHQHQIAPGLVDLCVQDPALVGRDGDGSASAIEKRPSREFIKGGQAPITEVVKLYDRVHRVLPVEEANPVSRHAPNALAGLLKHLGFRPAFRRDAPDTLLLIL